MIISIFFKLSVNYQVDENSGKLHQSHMLLHDYAA